ncbi:hypothetical protein [Jeongeupia chitinilytica]|uniref:Peptidase C-terminal archaeal/bacterial domain-containing protein n=1 Tax=Jeongeupia chitinilytica TaxID=1041641 RepID=A0ABQ3H1R5_9NEIS|nr:hypothetical protein [Jeongeupia chitinilytica]GHD66019.1 hypothetical protein GCM10007350_27550 [Jeongeupia chitinilytica]
MFRASLLVLSIAVSLPAVGHAADTTQTVRFARGASSTRFQHKLAGREVRDYVLGARAGQTLVVDLKPGSVYFNVLPTGTDTALYNGSINGSHASIPLPHDGNYTVRVYQMGAAASSGKTSAYTLQLAINDSPAAKPAQTATVDVSDLVDARAAGGETALTQRGFSNVDGYKHSGKSYTLWWNAQAQQCVRVATANGRYTELTQVDAARCR